jgi:UDP-N-acetylmuramate-alanine ligase
MMSKQKHIHILGVCGTFMGGIAAIAKQAGYRVTGCDANVYPPMSTQLEEQGIELIEGWGAEQLELKPDVFVIGNVVSRGNPLMEEVLNRNLPCASGPQWLADTLLRHARQNHHYVDARMDTGTWGAEPRLPDRRRAAELRHLGTHHRCAILRHRGGRV